MNYQIKKSEIAAKYIDQYAQLLSQVFTHTTKFTSEFVYWQYACNPNGLVVGTDAFCDDLLVAHHACIPVNYTIFGKSMKGLLAINNVTHPAHQGKGLFVLLGEATFAEAKKLNFEFVITVTNQNSTYGYLNKFNFRQIAPLDVKLGIGKIMPNSNDCHQVFENWTDDLFAWRLANPSSKYCFNNNSIITKTQIPGIYAQLKYCEKAYCEKFFLVKKMHLCSLWIGLANKQTSGLFINLPSKLKSSPLNLLFKDLQGNIPYFDQDDICFELIDFDAF